MVELEIQTDSSIKSIWDVPKEQPTSELFQIITSSYVEETHRTKTSHNTQKVLSWSFGMKGHAAKCVERCYELAKKSVSYRRQMEMPSFF